MERQKLNSHSYDPLPDYTKGVVCPAAALRSACSAFCRSAKFGKEKEEMIKCYKSKIYQGENFDYQVSNYYGGGSYPIDFLYVVDEFTKGDRLFCRSAENKVYTNKASALKRARWLAKNT